MRKFSGWMQLLVVASAFLLQGCIKDKIETANHYTFYAPVYATKQEVRENIRSASPLPISAPGKIYFKDNYVFVNEVDKGIHVINNENPSSPKNVAFIAIPGNMDMAIKENTLFADLYTDLVAIDITDPKNSILKDVTENIFPNRYYASYFRATDGAVITKWEKRDTTVYSTGTVQSPWGGLWAADVMTLQSNVNYSNKSAPTSSPSPYGMGGSMARFTLAKERLYTLGNGTLDVFNVVNSFDPLFVSRQNIGWEIETIFPFKENLFIGTQIGMQIFSISDEDNPKKVGQAGHLKACDPVVANDKWAFVTLLGGRNCGNTNNELQVFDINNIFNPQLVKTYPLTGPRGLSLDGDLLFICDNGLKVYDARDVKNLKLLSHVVMDDSYDVIAYNKIAMVVGSKEIMQFDYSNPAVLKQLSVLPIQNQ